MTQTMIKVTKAEVVTLKDTVTAEHKRLSEDYKHVYNLLGIMDERLHLIHKDIKEYIKDPVRFQRRMETQIIAAKTIAKRPGLLGLFSKGGYIPEQKKVTYKHATPLTVRSDVKNHILRTLAVAGYEGTIKRVVVEETHWSRMCPLPWHINRGLIRDYISVTEFNGTCRIMAEVNLSDKHLQLRSRLDEVQREKSEINELLVDLDMATQCDRDIFMPLEKYIKATKVKK